MIYLLYLIGTPAIIEVHYVVRCLPSGGSQVALSLAACHGHVTERDGVA